MALEGGHGFITQAGTGPVGQSHSSFPPQQGER